MAKTYLDFPFDGEIFNYAWQNAPDLFLDNMINSGAVVQDQKIADLISNGSNLFTTPFYNPVDGEEVLYDGKTNITTNGVTGGQMTGCVFGRAHGWDVKSFINDFNSGAKPMEHIVSSVALYWSKKRQARFIGILGALFGIVNEEWAKHTLDLATDTPDVTEANLIGATTIGDACVKANGDHAQGYALAIMHSTVANRLANLQLLEYSKYTDDRGITRPLPIGTINGLTVIVNDGVPVADSESAEGSKEYTTYLLGKGVFGYAKAPVEVPAEIDRDPAKNGGTDMLFTRIRECFVPYGISFKGNIENDAGVSDVTLFNHANWELKMDAKSIMMAKVVTNG